MIVTKYRKKPVVIEAVQWRPGIIHEAVTEIEIGDAITEIIGQIKTLEGVMTAQPGDWIIQGIQGEFYPCKPDIFEATYELAE